MNQLDVFDPVYRMWYAMVRTGCDDARRSARSARRFRKFPPRGLFGRWHAPTLALASTFFATSCVGPGQTIDSHGLPPASAGDRDAPAAQTVARDEAQLPPAGNPPPLFDILNARGSAAVEPADASGSAAGRSSARGTAAGGRRVSLRPRDNPDADDLLDHWGHRRNALVSERMSPASRPGDAVDDFRDLLDAARKKGAESAAPELRDDDPVTVLGRRRGVAYGRWSGGPADTLSIDFDLQYAARQVRDDRAFGAALERAGKAWSRRIDDTWAAWERNWGESKGTLVGNNGAKGREVRVGPGGETSTGLVVYVTSVDLAENTAGLGGPSSIRSGNFWEPHTGAIGFDRDYLEEAEEGSLFRTMVHELGHVLGAWMGDPGGDRFAHHLDRELGAWTGPNVVAVHGGPAPFQDDDDSHGWHDGERSPDADRIDYAHSGVCASVMSYCGQSAGIPAILPADIDFAFLADLGMKTTPETDRPETYGLAGWMEHSAFTLSVSRELEVSLADPQPRYSRGGARFGSLDSVDILWAEADAFGNPSTAGIARSRPLSETVRYSGGLIGTAIELPGFPPVHGDANLSVSLDSLTGKASFTSLEVLYDGTTYGFAGGRLHYPFSVEDNAITHESPWASLVADFYGPRHEEVAGTLDDSRAGLVASFGSKHDERPSRAETIAAADHVRGMMHRNGFSDTTDGWYRFRCGAGSGCEGRFKWWEADSTWNDVDSSEDRSPRERVLDSTAGWGEWMSEDMFVDHGGVRIERRHAGSTDGATGRYQADGYFGSMNHAAFGTGFHSFREWEGRDGEIWNSAVLGTGFQGDLAGTRPVGGATWDGRMVGYQTRLEAGEERFVQGHARVRVSFDSNQVDIGFSGVTSTDFKRSLADFGFDAISIQSDGTFDGWDEGTVEGAFFGPSHQEVAGMFQKNENNTMGSFGAVKSQ